MRAPTVIVGAGPAGMAAAIELADAGVRPVVVDESPRPGGQIYRQSAVDPAAGRAALVQRFERRAERIDHLANTCAWGAFPERTIAVLRDGRSETLAAEHLILATGAHEYLPPFPGWTLPGVMTPGAAQALVKTMGVRPGRRALLAGTGPFLLVVADNLLRSGVEVAGVFDLASTLDLLGAVPRLLARPALLAHGALLTLRLRAAGVRTYHRQVLVQATGRAAVTAAVVARCDADGRPDLSRTRTLEVDTICAGYGFVPRIQLAQLLGCRLEYREERGGWLPERSVELETSAAGVFVAGDGGGISGALAAELEGALAGLAVAKRLGAIAPDVYRARCRLLSRELHATRRFAAGLQAAFPLRPGLIDLASPDTLVCRCEELTRRTVEESVAYGGTDLRTLKVMSRLGMGPCQGAMCWPATARMIAAKMGASVASIGPARARPPIVPLTVGEMGGDAGA